LRKKGRMKKILLLLSIGIFSLAGTTAHPVSLFNLHRNANDDIIYEAPGPQWEDYDKIVAVVNNSCVVQSEIERKLELLKKNKVVTSGNYVTYRNKLIDEAISQNIIIQVAEKEAILVTDERVNNEISKMMQQSGIKTIDDFAARVEKSSKMSFEDYKEQLRIKIMTDLVMTIAVDFTPPSLKEAQDFYNKNKGSAEFIQVNTRHILIIPKRMGDFKEEKAANQLAEELVARINKGESFDSLAAKYSQDPGSAKSGGNIGWRMLLELDPGYANGAYQMKTGGLAIIKSGYGYHVVKLLGRKVSSFQEMEDMIYGLLSNQSRGVQFQKWLKQKRKVSQIIVYYPDYKQTDI
jgi:peptidyl-prolyl cis-trans isomerase SurA